MSRETSEGSLTHLALAHLRHHRATCPDWTLDDLLAHESLPKTPELLALAAQAGFHDADGYGVAPYGQAPYGGRHSRVSDGKTAVARRITTQGQLSYRGHTYTIGVKHRGRTAQVVERGAQLLVMVKDWPPVYMTRM